MSEAKPEIKLPNPLGLALVLGIIGTLVTQGASILIFMQFGISSFNWAIVLALLVSTLLLIAVLIPGMVYFRSIVKKALTTHIPLAPPSEEAENPQLPKPSSNKKKEDETYLAILQAEQDHTKTRWTVTTFFMSISFAIFGFSFQSQVAQKDHLSMRIGGLLIYWFALVLFLRFATHSGYLGEYLKKMETSDRTTLNIRERADDPRNFWESVESKWWLLALGVTYTAGVILLQVLSL